MADDFSQKAGQIRQFAALPPDQLIDKLTALHPNIDKIAPNVAPHIHSAAINAIQFLNGKLPHAGNELLQDKDIQPSKAQKKAWLDLHETVNNPLSVLDHVENGTLTGHHLEAMQSVYPDLHQEMRQKIQEQLGQIKVKGQTLPYAKRQSISKFIGQPLDSTMTQPNMMAIMASAGGAQTPQTGAKGKPSKASGPELNQINKVNQLYQTPSQARQAQKKE